MARPTLGDSKTIRMDMKITQAEVNAIDDWRFAHRYPSRAAAIRHLIKLALVWESHQEDRKQWWLEKGRKASVHRQPLEPISEP